LAQVRSYGSNKDVLSKIKNDQVVAVMGGQWGDEGKGKLVDVLGGQYNIIARCAGGSNAGHTVVVEGKKYAFHLMPSGILHPKVECLIGNGVVLHIPTLFKELGNLENQGVDYSGRIKLSDRAHIVFDFHQEVDAMLEEAAKKGPSDASIGTTKKGIGPCYTSKVGRIGVRVGDLLHPETLEDKIGRLLRYYQLSFPSLNVNPKQEADKYLQFAQRIRPMIIDSVQYINDAHAQGKRIMIEGANATMLDVDFGTWPYVTSSNASIGGAITGLGLSPDKIGSVIGIVKAYTTRVGAGPFPTELTDELGQQMRHVGHEYGTTTGRPRRCGWLDLVALRYVNMVNNFTAINLTKLDVLSQLDQIKIGVAYRHRSTGQLLQSYPSSLETLQQVDVVYETLPGWKQDISNARSFADLPPNALRYVKRIQELSGCTIGWVGVGPGREAMAVNK
jgi:adenylosuccinate synthase